jgi:hypothetical protein
LALNSIAEPSKSGRREIGPGLQDSTVLPRISCIILHLYDDRSGAALTVSRRGGFALSICFIEFLAGHQFAGANFRTRNSCRKGFSEDFGAGASSEWSRQSTSRSEEKPACSPAAALTARWPLPAFF